MQLRLIMHKHQTDLYGIFKCNWILDLINKSSKCLILCVTVEGIP